MAPSDFTDMPFNRRQRTRLYPDDNTACGSYSIKRPLESEDIATANKRTRYLCDNFASIRHSTTEPAQEVGSSESCIVRAVEETGIEASESCANILPNVNGKHSDLNAISSQTMSAILDGHYDNQITKVSIIDCRYPYEYEGGHIKGAINLYTKELVQQFLNQSASTVTSTENHVLIFHCEFSSKRGPKMYRYLRSLDRDLNKDNYPRLNFPEIYLLEGGYKKFFESNKEQCFPQTYMPMLDKEHKADLRHFRVKSKSWSAGDRPHRTSLKDTAIRLLF